jgi:hypothetical protein
VHPFLVIATLDHVQSTIRPNLVFAFPKSRYREQRFHFVCDLWPI